MGKRLGKLKAKAKRAKKRLEEAHFKLKKAKVKGELIYWKSQSALIQAKREGRKLMGEIREEMHEQFGDVGVAGRREEAPIIGSVGDFVLPQQPKPKKRKKKKKRRKK